MMMTEELGTIRGYSFTLSPNMDDDYMQIGPVMVNEGEEAHCETRLDGMIIVSHVVKR